jgi:hypothetical protein
MTGINETRAKHWENIFLGTARADKSRSFRPPIKLQQIIRCLQKKLTPRYFFYLLKLIEDRGKNLWMAQKFQIKI